MSYDRNVYYNPEKCGLELVASLDEGGLSYEYNTFIVVRELTSGRLFYATDSGCSCPTPFENYIFDDGDNNTLSEIKIENFESFSKEVDNFPSNMTNRIILLQKTKNLLIK